MFRRLNARILIALLGLVVFNVAVARKSQPVSPEILEATTMRFYQGGFVTLRQRRDTAGIRLAHLTPRVFPAGAPTCSRLPRTCLHLFATR